MEYKPNHRGTGKLLRSEGMQRLVMAKAEEGAEAARAAAPDAPPYGTGLVSSIRVEYGGDRGGPKKDRPVAFIVADTPYAAYVHYGTKHQKSQPFMQAAIDAIHDPKT